MNRGIDVTMLAWSGWRGMLARKRWETKYGSVDLARFVAFAEARHGLWVEKSYALSLTQNWRGTWYVLAAAPTKEADE